MDTVFGVKWPLGTPIEVIFVLVLISLIISLFVLYQYISKSKSRHHQDRQALKFHLLKLGLSAYQIELFRNMLGILRLPAPVRLLNDPSLFERAIGDLFARRKADDERVEYIPQLGREITDMYTKLYQRQIQPPPVSDLGLLGVNQPVCASINNAIYIGRVFNIREYDIGIQFFFGSTPIDKLRRDDFIKVSFLRVNDAEYEFDTRISQVKPPEITVALPPEIKKSMEFRHPFIDVDIPCTILQINVENIEEEISYNGFLLKINEYEAAVKLPIKLEFNYQYYLEFELVKFNFVLKTHLISESRFEKDSSYQCSLRIDEISPAAKGLLSKYISDRL